MKIKELLFIAFTIGSISCNSLELCFPAENCMRENIFLVPFFYFKPSIFVELFFMFGKKQVSLIMCDPKSIERISIECNNCTIEPSQLDEYLNMKICIINLKGSNGNLPLQLFHRNKALEGVSIIYQPDPSLKNHPYLIEDGFFSNLENLEIVELISVSMNNSIPVEFLFENSTSLEYIKMQDFGLVHIRR